VPIIETGDGRRGVVAGARTDPARDRHRPRAAVESQVDSRELVEQRRVAGREIDPGDREHRELHERLRRQLAEQRTTAHDVIVRRAIEEAELGFVLDIAWHDRGGELLRLPRGIRAFERVAVDDEPVDRLAEPAGSRAGERGDEREPARHAHRASVVEIREHDVVHRSPPCCMRLLLRRPDGGASRGSIATSSTNGPRAAIAHASAAGSSVSDATRAPSAPIARTSATKSTRGRSQENGSQPIMRMPCAHIR
jgi:hypothetical protein